MLEINGKKYYHIFTAGEFTQGPVTVEMLREVVNNYDPVNFHEAPVWIGHPTEEDEGSDEPRAFGWIESLILQGTKLYASFSFISDELKILFDTKKFKYVSCEFVKFNVDGNQLPYLYALGATNRPAVKDLEPLSFKDHKFKTDFISKIKYEQIFTKQNHIIMNEFLIAVATAVGLDLTKFTTDSSLRDAIVKTYSDFKTGVDQKIKDLEAKLKLPGDDSKFTELQNEFAKIKDERCEDLVNFAIAEGKILPATKDGYIKLAKADYDSCKKVFSEMKPSALFAGKQIKDNGNITDIINLEDPKFKTSDGKDLKYTDVLKDAALLKKFSEQELQALRDKSDFKRD